MVSYSQPALTPFREETLGHRSFAHGRDDPLDPLLISVESQWIAAEHPATDEHRFVYDRYRDSHDLWHVLTGWGTDMAGEAGIVAWLRPAPLLAVDWHRYPNRPLALVRHELGLGVAPGHRAFHMADAPGAPPEASGSV